MQLELLGEHLSQGIVVFDEQNAFADRHVQPTSATNAANNNGAITIYNGDNTYNASPRRRV
jgi:formylmethanofuran dehydrogenase subunit B